MTTQAAGQTGVLVLSAWLEPHGPPLRVRITGRLDVQATEETSVTVAGAEVASGIVREWLLSLERQPPEPTPSGPSASLSATPASSLRLWRRKETT